VNTGGVPNGVAFDPNGVVYICDFAHQAVLTLGAAEDGTDQQLTAIVKDYEGKNLKVWPASAVITVCCNRSVFTRGLRPRCRQGPNSVAVDSKGTVYFTDSGPFGGSTLASPKGSVFCISADGRLLQPLALSCLAHPSGVAVSPDEKTLCALSPSPPRNAAVT
jgi:sugar lactone lactonase YvrE